jgi:hypothetical protein
MIPAGGHVTVKVAVPHAVRKRIRLLGRGTTKARLRVSVAGINGASTVRIRNIALAK